MTHFTQIADGVIVRDDDSQVLTHDDDYSRMLHLVNNARINARVTGSIRGTFADGAYSATWHRKAPEPTPYDLMSLVHPHHAERIDDLQRGRGTWIEGVANGDPYFTRPAEQALTGAR